VVKGGRVECLLRALCRASRENRHSFLKQEILSNYFEEPKDFSFCIKKVSLRRILIFSYVERLRGNRNLSWEK